MYVLLGRSLPVLPLTSALVLIINLVLVLPTGPDREQRYRRSKMHAFSEEMVLRDVQERAGGSLRCNGEFATTD